jgi:hypothetical protein
MVRRRAIGVSLLAAVARGRGEGEGRGAEQVFSFSTVTWARRGPEVGF